MPQRLLALLAIRGSEMVRVDRLIDELWAGEPPDGAAMSLRSYVSRLRTVLGETAGIRGRRGGYALAVDPDRVDARRFERLVSEGLRALEHRRYRHAAEKLRRALELWRDDAFAGIATDGSLHAEAARLEELRAQAFEARVEAELELGRSSELIDELQVLVAAFPYRERLWRHHMLALYRAGRQSEALSAYQHVRSVLDAELGLDPGPELQALQSAILRHEVAPPAGAAGTQPHAPPVPISSFVGRGRELTDVARLLARSRLVSLTGVGGVGKTRLAIEAAHHAATDYADGAAFVDLSTISQPALLVPLIATTLALGESSAEPLEHSLSSRLRDAELLIVLDNCEHLVEAAAAWSGETLSRAPGLRILATSREPLGVPGEVVYQVPPLGVPTAGATMDELRTSESVRLLLERVPASGGSDPGADAEVLSAARIATELEGLPLAIELAAGRSTALSLDEIADHLVDRFRFLVSTRRAPLRHRTLRAAVDWSFDLLAPADATLLAGLSVFAGTFDLRAVGAVCLDGDEQRALDGVERLVGASLVLRSDSARGSRYRLLETVRQYATEKLAADAREQAGRRHAQHVLELAESANLAPHASIGNDYDVVTENLPDIRSAIADATHTNPALALAIVTALERFWALHSPHEGIAMLDALVPVVSAPDLLRARGYRCRGGCWNQLGELERAVADYERALAIQRRVGPPEEVAHLVLRLALDANRRGNPQEAERLARESAEIAGDSRFLPDRFMTEQLYAEIEFGHGRHDDALRRLRAAAAAAAANDYLWWQGLVLEQIAAYSLVIWRADDADRAARQALEFATRAGGRLQVVACLAALAESAMQLGDGERAGRILGAVEAELDRGGPFGQWQREHLAVKRRIRDGAGPAFDLGFPAGRAMGLDELVRDILAEDV